MTRKPIRVRALTMIAALFASVALSVVAFPAAAQARCLAENAETTSHLVGSAGTIYATEDPVDETCNGNTLYRTYVQSNLPGWRVSFHLQSGGVWYSWTFGFDTVPHYVEFNDTNRHSLVHLCIDNGYGAYICGWGDVHSPIVTAVAHDVFGINDGY